ncbi:MAG: efflux RND transporter permease subunit [Tidjanibacter sp.]|nr:efflux RND transporter permease subunit [Tidjanibacter sp.]
MKIYESAVKKPISTILIFVGVVIFGLFSLKNLAIDQMPEMDIPALSVITTYQGVNASEIENNITRVLENQLTTVDNLKDMESTSSDGVSMVTLTFEWGTDMTEAANDVRDVTSRISQYLPDGADDPIVYKFNSSMMPVMVMSVTADESYPALAKILDEQMVTRLNRVDGVGAVSIMGAPTREIQINVDPRKIEAYGISVESIGGIIAQENVNLSSGVLDIGNNTYNLKTDGEFNSSDDLYNILISNRNGKEVYLKDIAVIKDTLEKATLDERINGKLGVRVIIQKQTGANTVDIVKRVKAALPEIEKNLPNDIQIGVIMDGSESIIDSINSLSETVMFALLFVVLVVLFFLGRWRATLIIALTIPISLIVAFIYLFATGSTLNIISLSSLSIAIGMVVDDAIVVLENITTHIEKGSSPREAAIYGTNEVWLSVIATTLVVVAVFLPLTMVNGIAGILFKELGWIVSLVVTTSTIAAISLTPMLSSMMLHANNKHTYKGLGVIFKPIDKFLNNLDGWYERLLKWAVAHRVTMFIVPLLLFILSLGLFAKIPAEFMPATDDAIMSGTVKLEQNVGVEYSKKVARQIDSIIYKKYPEITMLSTSTGYSSSNSSFMSTTGSNVINYMMKLPLATERERSVYELADSLRNDLAKIPEIMEYQISTGMGGAMGGVSNIELKIFGYDFEVTNAIAEELAEKSRAIKGIAEVQISRDKMEPEYNVKLDRRKLAYYGLTSSAVSSAIRYRVDGMTASLYREDGEEYDIVVRFDEQYRTSLEDIKNIIIYNAQGQAIRVSDVGEIVEEFVPPTIERENRQRIVTVTLMLADKVVLGEMIPVVNNLLAGYDFPDDVIVEVGGTIEDQAESFGDLGILALLIVLLVYIVMATQFESLLKPFMIMFTILFAVPGVAVALYITNLPLSLVALLGAIMLVGIVVKNGIVMVDYTDLLVERGVSVDDAAVAAGKSRLRPVLMTSLTTILGMLPMAIGIGSGSEMWQPMGVSIIGGLLISTFMTLLALPSLYSIFVGRMVKNKKKKELRRRIRMGEIVINNEE